MSTSKFIEKICIAFAIIAVLITIIFINGEKFGLIKDDSINFSYQDKIFDRNYVHSIDIKIDDWNNFIDTATSEEYSSADVTIDGEVFTDVAIRAKGNTSLTTVKQLNSERYSMKIEFDRFQSNKLYYGLDKLCLNNLIQDYTMLKDYVSYRLMAENNVPSPLVSFSYVTVNGEDWGLFLNVEAIEDAFLERNFGKKYGKLYKPDSTEMGGGRGNGGGFDMREVDFEKFNMNNPFQNNIASMSEMPQFNFPPRRNRFATSSEIASRSNMNRGFGGFREMGGFGGMGSDDAKLKYIDDDIDSYSNIFNYAKTTVTKQDKKRLIKTLKTLDEGIKNKNYDKIDEAVFIELLTNYMISHNFVVNGDSYTGVMIHNFYLYEEDGKITLLPWDYNLAFGGFQNNDSTASINDPIDTPLSISENQDRPAFDFITSNETCLYLYHQNFKNFIDKISNDNFLINEIDEVYNLIYEYVEKDPTKLCTTSDFEKAVKTLKAFIQLRIESIKGQLDGSIPKTDSEQEKNPQALIDASNINLSDMGSMGRGGMGNPRNGIEATPNMGDDINNVGVNDFVGASFASPFAGNVNDTGTETNGANTNLSTPNTAPNFSPPMFSNSANATYPTKSDYIWTFLSIIFILLALTFAYNYNKNKL